MKRYEMWYRDASGQFGVFLLECQSSCIKNINWTHDDTMIMSAKKQRDLWNLN